MLIYLRAFRTYQAYAAADALVNDLALRKVPLKPLTSKQVQAQAVTKEPTKNMSPKEHMRSQTFLTAVLTKTLKKIL